MRWFFESYISITLNFAHLPIWDEIHHTLNIFQAKKFLDFEFLMMIDYPFSSILECPVLISCGLELQLKLVGLATEWPSNLIRKQNKDLFYSRWDLLFCVFYFQFDDVSAVNLSLVVIIVCCWWFILSSSSNGRTSLPLGIDVIFHLFRK